LFYPDMLCVKEILAAVATVAEAADTVNEVVKAM
jgi:hypothetical protein